MTGSRIAIVATGAGVRQRGLAGMRRRSAVGLALPRLTPSRLDSRVRVYQSLWLTTG